MSNARRSQYTRISLWALVAFLLLTGSTGRAAVQGQAEQADGTFADAAFRQVWDRTDALVAQGAVSRTWLWGPTSGFSTTEPWAESPGGTRRIQYFDKGRMEINNPATPPTDPFYVTNGLLAYELISGQVQTGAARYTANAPAVIPMAGDRDDPTAPTYAGWRNVSNLAGTDRRAASAVGAPVNQSISRDGGVGPLTVPHSDYGVRVAYWEETTGHNVPDVFWTFLNGPGTILEGGQVVPRRLFDPWFGLTGLPISEAYWSYVKIGGVYADVLIQAFERRVLTYAPNNPDGFKVELGNIGLHYLEWRYGTPSAPPPAAPTPPPGPPPVVLPPDVRITTLTNQKPGLDLNFQSVTLVNASGRPVDLTGWRLVTPQGDHDEVYVFPRDTLAAGATLTVYAGWGNETATQLFMRRITWFFAGSPFDGVLLYTGSGQEVSRLFLSGGVAPTPAPINTPAATIPAGATATPELKPSATPTRSLPSPVASAQATVSGATATATATPTMTPGGGATATPTASAVPSGTPTPRAFNDGTALLAWVDPPAPRVGEMALLSVRMTQNGTPVVGANIAAIWRYPGSTGICPAEASDADGEITCDQLIPAAAANQTVWIDILARPAGGSPTYTTYTGIRPAP